MDDGNGRIPRLPTAATSAACGAAMGVVIDKVELLSDGATSRHATVDLAQLEAGNDRLRQEIAELKAAKAVDA